MTGTLLGFMSRLVVARRSFQRTKGFVGYIP